MLRGILGGWGCVLPRQTAHDSVLYSLSQEEGCLCQYQLTHQELKTISDILHNDLINVWMCSRNLVGRKKMGRVSALFPSQNGKTWSRTWSTIYLRVLIMDVYNLLSVTITCSKQSSLVTQELSMRRVLTLDDCCWPNSFFGCFRSFVVFIVAFSCFCSYPYFHVFSDSLRIWAVCSICLWLTNQPVS